MLLELLSSLDANVPRFYRCWVEGSSILTEMELCDRNLKEHIKKKKARRNIFSEFEVVTMLRDISLVLSKLHSFNYIHLDLTPSNLA